MSATTHTPTAPASSPLSVFLAAKCRQVLGGIARGAYCNRRAITIGKYASWLNIPENQLRNALAKERLALRKVDVSLDGGSGGFTFGDVASWREAVYRSIRLETVITYSVCLDCECLPQEIDVSLAVHRDAVIRHAHAAASACDQITGELDRIRPHVALILQGYNLENAILRQLCIQRNLPFVAFEITSRNDRLVWENISGITVTKNLARNHYWRWRDLIDPREADTFCGNEIIRTKQSKLAEHQSPDLQWRSPDKRPVILFLGQVYSDSSVLFGLQPPFTPETIVQSLLECAVETGSTLVLKLHPKENGGNCPNGQPLNRLTWRKLSEKPSIASLLGQLGGRVCVDHENRFDTYSMIEAADVVVTINSQAGLESAIRGKRVITCGDAFFGSLGFTMEARNSAELRSLVEDSIGSSETKRCTSASRMFFHIFFEKYCIPRTAVAVARRLAMSASGKN